MTNKTDLIVNSMPFSKDIKDYIKKYPDFEQSLKLYNQSRFDVLHTILISHPEEFPHIEVIGIFYFDKAEAKKEGGIVFKQDYIVRENNNFTSYTGMKIDSTNAKHISIFFKKFGHGVYYGTDNGKTGDHHYYSVDELPIPLQTEAKEALREFEQNEK